MLGLSAALSIGLAQFPLSTAFADDRAPAALTGQVTSDAESVMEGVVVTAHRDGRHRIDERDDRRKGPLRLPGEPARAGSVHHRNPRGRVTILSEPTIANVIAEKTTNLDLKLGKTKDLASQLNKCRNGRRTSQDTEEQKATRLHGWVLHSRANCALDA